MARADTAPNSILQRHAWLALAAGIAGVLGLRFGEGFARPVPGVIALLAFTLGHVLVSRVMRRLPVSALLYAVAPGI